jgi:hypothetical protein
LENPTGIHVLGKYQHPKQILGTDVSPKGRALGGTQANFRPVFMLTGGSADGFGLVAGGLQKGLDLLPGNQDFAEHFAGAEIPPQDEPPDGLGGTIEDCGGLVDVVSQGFREGRGRRGIWRFGRLDFLIVHSRFSLSFLSLVCATCGDFSRFQPMEVREVISELAEHAELFSEKVQKSQ